MLAIGTHDGLYTTESVPFERPDPVWDAGTVHAVEAVEGVGLLAATDEGLVHSRDGGRWTDLAVPEDPVVSVAVGSDGEYCYAGTYPAQVYRLSVPDWRAPERGTWTECESFRRLSTRERVVDRSPRAAGLQVRTLATHPDAPDRVVAGLEVGGVCVSDDAGQTWADRSRGVHDDVHHVLARSAEEYVAACGNGLYRTTDAGRAWLRVDTDFRDFWYNYHRESIWYEGRLFTAANGWGPAESTGAMVTLEPGGPPERVPFPGGDSSFVLSWATDGDRLFAGTMGVTDGFEQQAPADVLVRDDEWVVAGTAPAGVKSLAVY